MREDWEGWMAPGHVPADWRHRRLAVRARSGDPGARFLDVESPSTRERLWRELGATLAAWGYGASRGLDVAAVRGPDRRVTRLLSWWTWAARDPGGLPRYAGVRYLSRLDSDWECWALFSDRVPLVVREVRAIGREMRELRAVARRFGLTVH